MEERQSIQQAAEKTLGKRRVNKKKRPYQPWYEERVKMLAKEKEQAFINCKDQKTHVTRPEYIRTRNKVNQEIDTIKQENWEKFTKTWKAIYMNLKRKCEK